MLHPARYGSIQIAAYLKDVLLCKGKRQLVVRGGKEGEETILEIWRGGRVVKETRVPSKLHGGVYNDNWFSIDPTWSSDEARIAYVALPPPPLNIPHIRSFPLTYAP
jgi:hypothetical protein